MTTGLAPRPALAAPEEPTAGLTLTPDERREIAWRLVPLLAGGALLVLGFAHETLYPGQDALSALFKALAAAVCGAPFFVRGARGFLAKPTADVSSQLVALAVLAAMAAGEFTTATLVPLFMEAGRLFEERSSRGARAAIEGIRKLHARRATRLIDGREDDVDPASLLPGDRVLVRAGDVIPVDGRVLAGHSSVDQSSVTGESVLAEVSPGDDVFAGTINLGGLLRIETTRAVQGSALGRIVALLRDVEASKTPALRLVERVASVYLPVILTIAGVVLFASGELARAIAVLVVACPSALFLAGPAAMVAALSACTRRGVLIKSAAFLETVPEVRTLVLDKTGTVTHGALQLDAVRIVDAIDDVEILRAAAICGYGSMHPVSRAVLDEAERRGLTFPHAESLTELPGQGVVAATSEGTFRLGRSTWLTTLGLAVPPDAADGRTTAWVAKDVRVLGQVVLADAARPEARASLDALRRAGIVRHVLITGDRRDVALAIGREMGCDDVHAELLPEEKLALVRLEQEAGARVMMIGDGINDALALGGADVGVAVGARVDDVTLGGADVAVVDGDLSRLPLLVDVAHCTRRVILQNVGIVAVFGLGMIALAALGVVGPLTGAWLHNVDALLVVLNSARLVRTFAPPASASPGLTEG